MLTPEYLAQLPEPVIKLWQQVEDDILRDIARRIAKMNGLTESAAYQAFRLEQTRLLRQGIVKLLARYSGKTEAAIRNMMQAAATETIRSEDAIHSAAGNVLPPPNESPNLLNLLNAGYAQTIGTWKNLTATTANTVTKQFENALDRAWLQVSSGAFDYQTAIKRAIDDLSQHMDGVTYPTGHHDTLEVAVRRAVLTGTNQTCAKLQMERIKESGCEFVEVTAHAGARDDGEGPVNHARWQGKVYHIGGAIWYDGRYYEDFETVTGYGTGPGLCGWNCRHNFHAFYPGISVPAYSEELLASYTARNIEYNGQLYTKYEINQMQRALERKVRKSKLLWMAEKEAGLDSTTAAFKLKANRKKLNDFVKATGGRVDSSRTAAWNTSPLPGKKFSRSEASRANWDVRHAEMRAASRERNLQFIKDDATIKSSSGLPKKIQEADTDVAHTINVVLPKIQGIVPKGSLATEVYTMAGDGTSTPIRDLSRLYSKYPEYGDASGWKKKSGTVYAKHHHYVIHWYENTKGIPPDEIKLKGAK